MFRRVLVANRGEIAVRVFRTCHSLGAGTVAVYSDADRDALHAGMADEAVRIGGRSPAESYLSVPAIIEAALRTGADAIHPGYGFLAENAELADACRDADLTFVGPPADVLRVMGDKSAARRLAVEHDLPVLPGVDDDPGDDSLLCARAAEIGFPVMVKAAAGGGGRGMRQVATPDDLPDALAAARREAMGAFGNDRLLLERAVVGGRHVEVQILADAHGNTIQLGERDCSIQRRFQKVIEESPSPAVDRALSEQLGDAAVRLARAVGYRNAGTVEFLLERDGSFFFMEMNARLQVEHGLTELLTGLDLVAWQLRIAAGEPLDFGQEDVRRSGHAIECRVYAEDPARGYVPSSGRLARFATPEGDGIRNDVGVKQGSTVPPEYDPLLAKLLVHAPTREQAVERCAGALAAYVVDGVHTNLGLLSAVLASPAFISGEADLSTLASMSETEFAPRPPDAALAAVAVADLLPHGGDAGANAWEAMGAWRVDGGAELSFDYHEQTFDLSAQRTSGRHDHWIFRIGDHEFAIEAALGDDDELIVTEDGVRRRWKVARDAHGLVLEATDGRRYAFRYPRRSVGARASATGAVASNLLHAPMPGTIVRILVAEGDSVRDRQALVIMEAMKMEHSLEATEGGVVARVTCRQGQVVAAGDLLIELER